MKSYLILIQLEQFETINKLGLDLDSFELQIFLDPNNKSNIL